MDIRCRQLSSRKGIANLTNHMSPLMHELLHGVAHEACPWKCAAQAAWYVAILEALKAGNGPKCFRTWMPQPENVPDLCAQEGFSVIWSRFDWGTHNFCMLVYIVIH
jgi:hypothetical protein